MATPASSLDLEALARARLLLLRPERRERMWPVLGAAALLALSAVTFAAAMIMAPPLTSEHVASDRGAK